MIRRYLFSLIATISVLLRTLGFSHRRPLTGDRQFGDSFSTDELFV